MPRCLIVAAVAAIVFAGCGSSSTPLTGSATPAAPTSSPSIVVAWVTAT